MSLHWFSHWCVEISIGIYNEIDVDMSRETNRNYTNLFLLDKDKTFFFYSEKWNHQKKLGYKTGINLEYPTWVFSIRF